MAIRLKRYLRVAELTVESGGIRLTLGALPGTGYSLVVSDSVLELLALASEHQDPEDIFRRLTAEFPEVARGEFDASVRNLLEEGVLEEGVLEETTQRDVGPERDRERYDRHLLFYSMFDKQPTAIQASIRQRRVALLGVGGIGSWLAQLLAAAGVGSLILVDGDVVELSNLTRQTLYDVHVLGRPKVMVAAERLSRLNPNTSVVPVPAMITGPDDVAAFVDGCDMAILSADGPGAIHEWVEAGCRRLGVPYSPAGYVEYCGLVGPLVVPGRTPCLRCREGALRIDTAFRGIAGRIARSFQPPSFGPLNGVVASAQAGEALKFLGGFLLPPITLGRQLLIDFRTWEVTWQEFSQRPGCDCCTDPTAGQRR